jgi:hypothetical protein
MNKISLLFNTLIISLALVSCAGSETKTAISVDQLAASIEGMAEGDTLAVRGFCVDVCNSGASHITLAGEDSTQMIAAVASKELGSFDENIKYQYIIVNSILHEQKVDKAFLDNWEYRLDESLKGPNGNPEAVAQLKLQIAALRDSIDARAARCGKQYYSNYTLEAISYETDK